MSVAGAASTIARFGDGRAALAEARVGAGRLLVLASDLGRQWNNLPVQAAFVPLVGEIARHMLGDAAGARVALANVEDPRYQRPGVWPVGPRAQAAAVNVDVSESDQSVTTPDEFRQAIARPPADEARVARVEAARLEKDQGWWRYGMALLALALVAESSDCAAVARRGGGVVSPVLDPVRQSLENLSRAWWRVRWTRVLARAAGVVAGVLLAWSVADRLRPLGRWPLLLSGGAVAVVVAVAWWWVQRRVHGHPPVDRMARLVEEQCPELEATLRSALDPAVDTAPWAPSSRLMLRTRWSSSTTLASSIPMTVGERCCRRAAVAAVLVAAGLASRQRIAPRAPRGSWWRRRRLRSVSPLATGGS